MYSNLCSFFLNHRDDLSWRVSTHPPKISLWDAEIKIIGSCLWFQVMLLLILHCANAVKLWVSAAEVRGGFVFEGVVFLSLICGRNVLIPQEAEEMQRVDFLGYVTSVQGKIHVSSTYTCVSGSAQCSTEGWTVRKCSVEKDKSSHDNI